MPTDANNVRNRGGGPPATPTLMPLRARSRSASGAASERWRASATSFRTTRSIGSLASRLANSRIGFSSAIMPRNIGGGSTATSASPFNSCRPSSWGVAATRSWGTNPSCFQQEGLVPQLLVAATPHEDGRQLLNGEADVAVLPPPMFLGMMAEEKPILLFASLLANEPIDLVVRKDVAEARHLSLAAPLAERLRALKGIKVGVAGGPPPRLRTLFASVGMNADEDIETVLVWGRDQVQAFASRQVDALFAH